MRPFVDEHCIRQSLQFQRADLELAKTQEARAATHDKLSRQAEALKSVVEINAMNILIGFYDQEYKSAEIKEKTNILNKKKKMCARLEALIGQESE